MKDLSKKIIIANWKSELDIRGSGALFGRLSKSFNKKNFKNDIVILPDFLSLAKISHNKNKNIFYGAQDVSPFSFGAYTGEVAVNNIYQVGASYVLIGHSERRAYFSEDKIIPQKIKNVLEQGKVIPILCVGETWEQRKKNQTINVIKKQLQEAFSLVKSLRGKKIIIAYEPVWAIGSGRVVSITEAVLVHRKIREIMSQIFKNNGPAELGVVYGGSVNLKNYQNFKNNSAISGLLIGGASLKASDFIKIASDF